MKTAIQSAVEQYRIAYRRMATECVAWHLYRIPGTDRVLLMRSDAQWDIPVPPILVHNVHTMTEHRLSQLISTAPRN